MATQPVTRLLFKGNIALFRATEKFGDPLAIDYTEGWKKFSSGPLQTYDVPGTHLAMLDEPNVQALARYLKQCLVKAQNLPEIPEE